MTFTLSTLQRLMCRADTGDAVVPYEIDDSTLDAIFADPTLANGSTNLLRVYTLRMLVGFSLPTAVDDTGNIAGINSKNSQRRTNLIAALAYWESVCGISAGQSLGQTNPPMQRSDQQKTNILFRWQSDEFAARLMTNDPSALQDLEDE